ncbi:MAG TPA: DUF6036 family nucleotidyltransferase [Phycisphaerae bacterium]
MGVRGSINDQLARSALAQLGIQLGEGNVIEILVIGGAAAHLQGLLPPSMTTSDVDAIHFRPPGTVDEVLEAADEAAAIGLLPKGWLNHDDAGLYAHALPAGWENRRVDIGKFGRLHVYALSRQDLIAMKFYAHREVDMEHLHAMHVTAAERRFTETYLHDLGRDLPDVRGKIELALHILGAWSSAT